MNRAVLALIVSASMLMPLSNAAAVVTVFSATLDSVQEVPTNASLGTGSATVTIDDVALTMQVQVFFSGLIGNTTASHIHCCAPAGSNVGVATQTPTFSNFPLGVQSGAMNQTFDMTLATSYSAGFITANGGTPASAFAALTTGMAAGNAYFNLHTSAFPRGEIRGQLAAVPESSTWAMMLLGFGAIGVAVRRSRRLVVVTA